MLLTSSVNHPSIAMDSDQLIVVDLGALSKTKFADAIIDADFLESETERKVRIKTLTVEKEFECELSEPNGTYVIAADDGSALGHTRRVFSISSLS